jgi:methylenetetrahydrofolate dehydrogenase (NADP+)/methenyltetrahydrofolate cyclohydrolase
MPYIDCKLITNKILSETKLQPCRLEVIYNADDVSAKSYLESSKKISKVFLTIINSTEFRNTTSKQELTNLIEGHNANSDVHGILLMSPTQAQQNFECIVPSKRVEGNDCDDNIDRVNCTARACVEIIETCIPIPNKHFLIIGYGKAVGKPLAYLLMRKHAGSVTTVHKYTDQSLLFDPDTPYNFIDRADVIISAVGKPHFVARAKVENRIFIDAGISVRGGKTLGDVNPLLAKDNIVSPVPGGVGPVATSLLFQNIQKAARGEF